MDSPKKGVSNQVGSLALRLPPFRHDTLCLEVCEYFDKNPDILSVAVVDNERPIGLVNRDNFLLLFSNQFGHALFDKKPIQHAMDTRPLIVDKASSIALVGALILDENPGALLKGFIITDQDRYFGVGTALGMLHYSVTRGRERERELEAARFEAVLTNETKTHFLANMSHELRTPLNAIIGFSEIMCGEMFGPMGNQRYKDYAKDIHGSGGHLLGLVNDMLDVAQIESGQMKLHERNCDLHELIQTCFTQLSSKAQCAEIILINRTSPELPEVYGDDRKLRQVLLNLLSNAIKFTPQGGQISVQARVTQKGELHIMVIDNGIGIEQQDIPRVLEKFGQVENNYQRKFDGVGLGLPLTRSLVELHGGKLWIRSAIGKGTIVCITLPSHRVCMPVFFRAVGVYGT